MNSARKFAKARGAEVTASRRVDAGDDGARGAEVTASRRVDAGDDGARGAVVTASRRVDAGDDGARGAVVTASRRVDDGARGAEVTASRRVDAGDDGARGAVVTASRRVDADMTGTLCVLFKLLCESAVAGQVTWADCGACLAQRSLQHAEAYGRQPDCGAMPLAMQLSCSAELQ